MLAITKLHTLFTCRTRTYVQCFILSLYAPPTLYTPNFVRSIPRPPRLRLPRLPPRIQRHPVRPVRHKPHHIGRNRVLAKVNVHPVRKHHVGPSCRRGVKRDVDGLEAGDFRIPCENEWLNATFYLVCHTHHRSPTLKPLLARAPTPSGRIRPRQEEVVGLPIQNCEWPYGDDSDVISALGGRSPVQVDDDVVPLAEVLFPGNVEDPDTGVGVQGLLERDQVDVPGTVGDEKVEGYIGIGGSEVVKRRRGKRSLIDWCERGI
ncbi:hypothetical protein BC938DRAFT_476892 [Jimgerdemannia flammicorona]|uniref:Uncharacterized protein n=1 Tax=Jimgerdemannia flammicorona TaxID=994334 RepID=A0A433QQ33_9FUNG|nr:hypothetical protein BC938DRAFT_476892 [Jimgerdemannia flammicorona]